MPAKKPAAKKTSAARSKKKAPKKDETAGSGKARAKKSSSSGGEAEAPEEQKAAPKTGKPAGHGKPREADASEPEKASAAEGALEEGEEGAAGEEKAGESGRKDAGATARQEPSEPKAGASNRDKPAPKEPAPVPLVRWQSNMVAVLVALTPAALAALYFFGWRALAVLAVTNAFAFATEHYFTRQRKEPVTSAVFVTGSLLALSLPPRTPFWMCALGAVVGVTFGKELFGGMGRNVFNPALVGRAFLYVCFPNSLTAGWVEPLAGGAGGLAAWVATDAVTSATPLPLLAGGEAVPLTHLFLGAVPGSLGETCKVALLLGAAYLLWKKVASWEIMGSTVLSFLVVTGIFRAFGWGAGADPIHGVLAGGFLYGAVFMATDPVSANRTRNGRFAYGALIGLCTALIRDLGNFPEGIMFAILLGNTLGPITEEGLDRLKKWQAGEGEA